jgi:hypothetical protein
MEVEMADLVTMYRQHYADKSEAYCVANRKHVVKAMLTAHNETKGKYQAESQAINERLAALQREKQNR